MANPALAALMAQVEEGGGTTEFSGWIILLLFSAIFWMLVARSVKRRLDALGDLPDAASHHTDGHGDSATPSGSAQGVSSSDE